MTLIHLAEQMAGRNAFRRWANGPDGRPTEVEAGGCSDGFGRFDIIFASIVKMDMVGESCWRVFPAEEALRMATDAIRKDPMVTHCGDAACGRCRGWPRLVTWRGYLRRRCWRARKRPGIAPSSPSSGRRGR